MEIGMAWMTATEMDEERAARSVDEVVDGVMFAPMMID
jgi:hypothetical protein